METVQTTLIKGFQIASGTSETDKRFPGGSIRLQQPFFKEQGLDLDSYFEGKLFYGTLNLSIAPRLFEIKTPEYFMKSVRWTDQLPAENFYLSPAEVLFKGTLFKALLYIPDPSTKLDHFNPPTMVDVLTQPLEGITYGDDVTLRYNPDAVSISESSSQL